MILLLLSLVSFALSKFSELEKCCNIKDSELDLLSCSLQVVADSNSRSQKKLLALVTYATRDILSYAAYSLSVNTVFASLHNYPYFIMSPETGSEYDSFDQRWNRVNILLEGLAGSNNFLADFEYIIWFDADLIFLDFQFKFEELIAKHHNMDIIISSEKHSETGLANTGCFIIKNSLWSINFLSEWWNDFDHSIAHDQIFFSELLKVMQPGIIDHVLILPIRELNSEPPPYLHQRE